MADIRSTELMSAVDRAWLEMDEPGNPMIVSAIVEFDGVRNPRKLVATLVQRLLRYPRFRQRAQDDHTPPRWLEDEELHLGYHVRLRRLRGTDPEWELRHAIATEQNEELDRTLPLWRITVFPQGKDKTVLLFRAHHAIADGIALMKILLTLTDDGAPAATPRTAAAREHHARAAHEGPLGGLIDQLESANSVLRKIGEILAEDFRHPEEALHQLQRGRDAVAAVMRLLQLPENNPRQFRTALSGHRSVAWNGKVPFAPVRRFAKAQGVKINDVFLAALAGAFRSYLLKASGSIGESQNLRVSIPVNLRSDHDGSLGNRFGLVMLDLPVGVERRQERLQVVAERMNALKTSPEARAILATLAAAGHMPVAMEKTLVNFLASKTATVVSNLPGPKHYLHVGGSRLGKLVFWPPQAGGVGIGISLLTYAGCVTLGVSADVRLMPDPHLLVTAFGQELEAMVGPLKPARRTRTQTQAAVGNG